MRTTQQWLEGTLLNVSSKNTSTVVKYSDIVHGLDGHKLHRLMKTNSTTPIFHQYPNFCAYNTTQLERHICSSTGPAELPQQQ